MAQSSENSGASSQRLRIRVRGAVQGVGFRPFVYGLAQRYGLSGFVLNDQDGVLAEVEGEAGEVFLFALKTERPMLARIDKIAVTRVPAVGQHGFVIRKSRSAGLGATVGVPDAATCQACLQELFDPSSRYHLYPFVTCTDCGPRFTIARCSPYDRANTSMSDFELCARCASDYSDPASRRFHAEAIACPACGPRLSHPVAEIAAALQAGKIVALKGVGGFHLMCDARNERAVARLRDRKRRPARPFAVMLGAEADLRPYCDPTPQERKLLAGSARPIVLVARSSGLAPSVAPRLERIGVMLPATPLHHVLFHALSLGRAAPDAAFPLVTTSANIAGEPLIIDNEGALRGLADVADLIVTHDRQILQRADDSVMAVIDGAPAFMRRGQGFTPAPIDLGQDGPSVVAVGAHLKATICVTRGREAFVSQHLGDLSSGETVRFYQGALRRLLSDLALKPELVACDLHPDYRTTLIAQDFGLPVLPVQHHMAHLAAVAAEHHFPGPLLGVVLDGHGYGLGGAAWGGELMRRDRSEWRRVGGLEPLALLGGDRAAREPWRMGVAAMIAVGRSSEAAQRFSSHPLASVLAKGGAADGLVTSSMGRLFDAVAALLGVCEDQSYDGQAAIELEALAGPADALLGGFYVEPARLDFRPLLTALLQPGLSAREGSSIFHATLVEGLAEWIGRSAEESECIDIVLGGGCFANRRLAEGLCHALRDRGLRPWLPRAVPANDGGISFGQAALARARLMADRPTIALT